MDTTNIAVFIDFDNIVYSKFSIELVIRKLRERGRLVLKRAYADWYGHEKHKREFFKYAVELIELPTRHKELHRRNSDEYAVRGKNAADIKLVVDALSVAIEKDYIDTFVIVAGDSDYSPLIAKLRELNKYVIVIGKKGCTAKILAS